MQSAFLKCAKVILPNVLYCWISYAFIIIIIIIIVIIIIIIVLYIDLNLSKHFLLPL